MLTGTLLKLRGRDRWESAFAVLYLSQPKTLCLHKSTKEFSPFRAFPDEVVVLSSGASATISIHDSQSYCLALCPHDGSAERVMLAFTCAEDLSLWQAVLSPLPPSPPITVPRSAVAELEEKAQAMEDLAAALRADADAERQEARRLEEEEEALHLEMEALLDAF